MDSEGHLAVGDRVRVRLSGKYWRSSGWFEGMIVRIDPYTANRGFFWVKLDSEVQPLQGGSTDTISVLNPRHIRKI